MSIPESEKETIALAQEELDILAAIRHRAPSHRLDATLAEAYGVWTVCFRRYCRQKDLPWLWMTSVSKFMDYLDAHSNVSREERDRALDGIMFYLTDVRKAKEDEESASNDAVPTSTKSLFAQLLLQCDLQLTEAMHIRLQDVRLDEDAITLQGDEEHDSRRLTLPSPLQEGFEKHVQRVEERSTDTNPLLFGHRGFMEDLPDTDDEIHRSTEIATRVMQTLDEAESDDE